MLLLDNSAWARFDDSSLAHTRSEQIAQWMDAGELGVCLPFLLEAGYSARSAAHHDTIMRELQALPTVAVDAEIERLALGAQQALARAGHHRVPPSDLVIATCAHVVGAGVLHYDRDYDVIAGRTDLEFTSEWLAPAGSL